MDNSQIGLYIAQGALIIITLINIFGKRFRGASDINENRKIGDEFLRTLLQDAKSEREELRKTVKELQQDAAQHAAALERLNALLVAKDERIEYLEELLENLTAKLRRGEDITIDDLLGINTGSNEVVNIDTHSHQKKEA